MTGFSRAEGVIGNTHYTMELKSVNHRYLDIRFRAPAHLSMFEIPLSELLRARFNRGAFEISLRHKLGAESAVTGGTRFVVDTTAAQTLCDGVKLLHAKFGTPKEVSLEFLAATGRVFLAVDSPPEEGSLEKPLADLFDRAAKELEKMRASEGKKLQTMLLEGCVKLAESVQAISMYAASHPAAIERKLKDRIANWKLPSSIESGRLEWEVAFYAERADITEEIQRLNAHTSAFEKFLAGRAAMGRKLDFLIQEMHREVNTIASKTGTSEITRLTVEAKTNIEKLREQVQNVE